MRATAAREAGLGPDLRNPFRSIVVRAVEIVCAVEEALRLIDGLRAARSPGCRVRPRAGIGHGVSEAPSGPLYHRYEFDADGLITAARIVPPTSQNQAAIEADLRAFVQARLTSTTPSSPASASRPSATTTPASPARLTSWT